MLITRNDQRCRTHCFHDTWQDRRFRRENGYHSFVEVDGERRIFRYYNDYFYGSKEYLLIVWEKEKGIVYYMRGNGAMNMHVEFGVDLKREQLTDYGNPYRMFH